MEANNSPKEWIVDDGIDTSGLIGFKKFEEDFNKAQEEKYAKKLAEIEAGEDKEGIMFRIEAMNAEKRLQREMVELEEYEKKNNPPQITFSLSDLLAKDFPPIQWLVDKLIPDRGFILDPII